MSELRPIEEPIEETLIEDIDKALTRKEKPREVKEARVGKVLEEAQLLTEGVCFDAVITRIELGRFGDFVPPPEDEERRKRWERRKDRMAYRFTFETPFGTYTDVIVISAHQNSRMRQLAKCYKVIRVGQKVKVCIENGRPRISC